MIRLPSLFAALMLALLPASATAGERAIWIWEQSSYAMLEDAAAADAALELLLAQRIDTAYLYADAFKGRNLLAQEPSLYRQFIRRLHASGLRVYALLGSAYLNTEEYVLPERRGDAVAMLQRVLDYNAAAGADERFDGINLDIEPHILDEWATRKLRLLGQFLDLGQALMSLQRASGQNLDTGPAIPFWLDGIWLEWQGAVKPVSEHVLGIFDYAALMDYRNHAAGPDGIISHAADEMTSAASLGRKVVIGVEVSPGGLEKLSFNHLRERDLERELALTRAAFEDNPAFGGFAIHHFRTYRDWLADERATGR